MKSLPRSRKPSRGPAPDRRRSDSRPHMNGPARGPGERRPHVNGPARGQGDRRRPERSATVTERRRETPRRVHESVEPTVIVGRHPVLESLEAGIGIVKILAAQNTHGLFPLLSKARELGVPVERVQGIALDRLSGGARHQGVAAFLSAAPYADEGEVVQRVLAAGPDGLLVVLDEVMDPGNLGAVLRSAEAFGAQGAVLPERRAAGLTLAAVRASAGAAAHIPVERVGNLAKYLELLRGAGVRTVATVLEGGVDLGVADLSGPLALVVGSEDRGIRRLVRERCDVAVKIPMNGRVASLNVSVASGILLYEVQRRRARLHDVSDTPSSPPVTTRSRSFVDGSSEPAL